MGIKETRPEEKVLLSLLVTSQQGAALFGNPLIVMIFFRDLPAVFLSGFGSCRRLVVIPPIFEPPLFHPECVMLTNVSLIGVVAS